MARKVSSKTALEKPAAARSAKPSAFLDTLEQLANII
jgi:hypothetical protein